MYVHEILLVNEYNPPTSMSVARRNLPPATLSMYDEEALELEYLPFVEFMWKRGIAEEDIDNRYSEVARVSPYEVHISGHLLSLEAGGFEDDLKITTD